MMQTPDIESERLVLRRVCMEDAPDIYAYVQNPNVLRYTSGVPPHAFAETEAFVRQLANTPDGEFAWAIRHEEQSVVIGVIEFGTVDGVGGRLDFALAEEQWNRGIMTESVQAVLDWAFDAYPTLLNVTSAAMTANPASTRVQQKCGMSILRTEYKVWSKFNEPVEVAVCGISREEWANHGHHEPNQ